ncbi:hypothetical protein Tco_1010470 [Tanacetum coccineum]
MATLEFNDTHNMVAFLQKPTGSEEFHQIVDFLVGSHIRYALTANLTIYTSLIEQFWQIATVETVNNGEQQLTVTVDGQGEGPSSPGGTQHTSTLIETSPQLQNISNTYRKTRTRTRRMGIRIPQFDVPSSVADEAIIKEMHNGLVRATTTASSIEAEQGSGNIAKTQTKATSSRPSSPRTSSEGGPRCHFTMGDIPIQARPERVSNLPNKPPLKEDKVTSLGDELASTKAVYNKALFTLTKRGRMIEEINKDETVNLVKSRELGKSHDTAEDRMESEHDDDDRTLAETLLNIKRGAAKGKAIMQGSDPPKKIKKKEMIQISLDEEFAKSFYKEEQAQILQDEVYAKQVEAPWIANEERIPQEAKQTDETEKVINWNDPDVLRYHAVQNRPFSKAEVRKNMLEDEKQGRLYKTKDTRIAVILQPDTQFFNVNRIHSSSKLTGYAVLQS